MTLREEVARAVTRFDDPENEDQLWPYALPEADAAIAIVLERAAKVCEDAQETFLSEHYAVGQPISSIGERFACGKCAEGIRALSEEGE